MKQGSCVLWAAAAAYRFMYGAVNLFLVCVGLAQTEAGLAQLTD